ncbi:hypothetical protein FHS39_000346 [Streptomyces olivoverticillatus]|uniref:Uncharacterized protein n=1 Tax=Streptomyces olivoverticillatus TaxID=66427 RepID=A0A7W7LKL3_9ACTN|nr:hypothetical protein [Streptomyces olivoverticillatus]MBB4891346.1 hypothetical protein [Streptomyces olivoverticillatus]
MSAHGEPVLPHPRRTARAVALLTALLVLAPVRAAAAPGDGPPDGPRLVLDEASVEVGDTAGIAVEGMTGRWDELVVTSPALTGTLRLTPETKGASHSASPRMPQSLIRVRSGIPPGTYPITADSGHRPTSPHPAAAHCSEQPGEPLPPGRERPGFRARSC